MTAPNHGAVGDARKRQAETAPEVAADEREALASVLHDEGSCQYQPLDICDYLADALLASPALATLRARWQAEARAEAEASRDRAIAQCRHLHQDGKTREQWHLDNCGAFRAIRAIEALADEWGWITDEDASPSRYEMWRQLRDALSARIEGEARVVTTKAGDGSPHISIETEARS